MPATPRPRPGRASLVVHRREAGLGDRHLVHPQLGDCVPVQAQERDVRLHRAQRPRVGFHIRAAQQQEGGRSRRFLTEVGGGIEPRSPQRGGGGLGGSTLPTQELNSRGSRGAKGGVRERATVHAWESIIAPGPDGPTAPGSSRPPRHGQQGLPGSQRGKCKSHDSQGTGQGGGIGGRGRHLATPGSIPASCRLVGAPCWPVSRAPPILGGGGGGVPCHTPPAPSARESRSVASAGSQAIPPPPHTGVGPAATAGAGSPHGEGLRAITSQRDALVGGGHTDTLLPDGGYGPQAHPTGNPPGAGSATNPGGTKGHHVAPGRRRGLWAFRHPPAG